MSTAITKKSHSLKPVVHFLQQMTVMPYTLQPILPCTFEQVFIGYGLKTGYCLYR